MIMYMFSRFESVTFWKRVIDILEPVQLTAIGPSPSECKAAEIPTYVKTTPTTSYSNRREA